MKRVEVHMTLDVDDNNVELSDIESELEGAFDFAFGIEIVSIEAYED